MTTLLLLTLAGVHLLAVMSPGPDFALVASRAVTRGRKPAVLVALGIALGVIVHVAAGIAGLSVLLTESANAYAVVKYAGGAYLMWIGWKCLRSKVATPSSDSAIVTASAAPQVSAYREVATGFLTNALNVKAAIYFLALFSQVVTGLSVSSLVGVGALLVAITFMWFGSLGWMLSTAVVRVRFARIQHWFERCCGVFLIILGARVAFAPAK